EFGPAQHKAIAFIAGGVIYFDAHVEAQDEKGKIETESEACADSKLPVEGVPLKFGIPIRNGFFVYLFRPGVEGPHVTGVEEDGTVDESEQFLAQLDACLDENVARFFKAVVKQAVGLCIGAEVGFERTWSQPPRSPGPHTTAAACKEELFIGNGIVVAVSVGNPGIQA